MPLSGEVFAERLRDFFTNPSTQALAVDKTKTLAQSLLTEYSSYLPLYYNTHREINIFWVKIEKITYAATVIDEIYKFVEKRTFSLNGSSNKLITELLLASYDHLGEHLDKKQISIVLHSQCPGFVSKLGSLLPITTNHLDEAEDFHVDSAAGADTDAASPADGRTSSLEVETQVTDTPPLITKTPPLLLVKALAAPKPSKYGSGDEMIITPSPSAAQPKYHFGNFSEEEIAALNAITNTHLQLRFPSS